MGRLLLRWVMREGDALCDIALQPFYTGLEKRLFVLVEAGEWVVGFLCSGGLFLLASVRMLRGGDVRLVRRERRRSHNQSP